MKPRGMNPRRAMINVFIYDSSLTARRGKGVVQSRYQPTRVDDTCAIWSLEGVGKVPSVRLIIRDDDISRTECGGVTGWIIVETALRQAVYQICQTCVTVSLILAGFTYAKSPWQFVLAVIMTAGNYEQATSHRNRRRCMTDLLLFDLWLVLDRKFAATL